MVYIETTTDDLIVLNPRWLCSEVLGKLLGDRSHLPSDGRLTATQLTELFPGMDITDSTTLLTALELCSVVSPGSAYQLSFRNSLPLPGDENRKLRRAPCVGGVALVADARSHLRHVFPRVQHAIWNSPAIEQPTEWKGGMRFHRSSGSALDDLITVRISTEGDEDWIRVVSCGHNPQTLYESQESIVATVIRVIDTCCPGVYLQLRALSPRDIKDAERPVLRAYSAREVAAAQLEGRGGIQLSEEEDEETLVDVLAFGDEELYSTLRPGVDLHVSEMPMYTRCRLAALLDPPHPQGRDWLLLALGLGLGDSVPRLDSQDVAALSRTVCLLALWSSDQEATVRRLLDVVRRTIQRPDVEEALLQLMPLCRPATGNQEPSESRGPGSNHVANAECNHSNRNRRKSSTASA